MLGPFFLGLKRPGREADSSTEFKMRGAIHPFPSTYRAWCLITHKDGLSFTIVIYLSIVTWNWYWKA